ncbi:DUF1667 domain-containing protein [Clostridium botulinum C]|uniref:DUF1667 domain-containing protein n=3 Tax=Clostridium botulinum TaxID=1491 RepID=A0A9Q4TLS3_CLOBO|nr:MULTISPECIES: DUF1667 domain-containing protein [Clostridium]AYF54112.1 DUF1667 domain-containing protein [Clostridium novyi]EES92308.1 zinc finger protein [Clostridium botulinum D str. 1873]MBO3440917.1 DUF1667 domain-containing protein [Clostridium haemolyticum]MCD3195407.1 DUF1667 domain-containing protein [Clostridium botulinum C]MCD3200823.1 DUF1667 domain-containing protein [Clostridium botulinum C]
MSEMRELTCIGCPMGCLLEVTIEDGKVVDVKGNSCLRGKTYAEKECTNPTRIVTSSVKVQGGEIAAVSVKTECDIPKDKIFKCVEELRGVTIPAPIKVGDVIVKDIVGTGVNIIATKSVAKVN